MKDRTEAEGACFVLSAFVCAGGVLAALLFEGIPGSDGQRGVLLLLPFLAPVSLAAIFALRSRALAVMILSGGLVGACGMSVGLFVLAAAVMVS